MEYLYEKGSSKNGPLLKMLPYLVNAFQKEHKSERWEGVLHYCQEHTGYYTYNILVVKLCARTKVSSHGYTYFLKVILSFQMNLSHDTYNLLFNKDKSMVIKSIPMVYKTIPFVPILMQIAHNSDCTT